MGDVEEGLRRAGHGFFCSRGSLTPVPAPNVSPNDFLAEAWCLDSKEWIRSRRLKDVAWGPSVKTGAGVSGYSGGLAACAVVADADLL